MSTGTRPALQQLQGVHVQMEFDAAAPPKRLRELLEALSDLELAGLGESALQQDLAPMTTIDAANGRAGGSQDLHPRGAEISPKLPAEPLEGLVQELGVGAAGAHRGESTLRRVTQELPLAQLFGEKFLHLVCEDALEHSVLWVEALEDDLAGRIAAAATRNLGQ